VDAAGAAPACPFCGSGETELMSLFGSSPLTSQYYCRTCRTVFEQVKWGTLPAGSTGPAVPADGRPAGMKSKPPRVG
jgi:hypothetical protein